MADGAQVPLQPLTPAVQRRGMRDVILAQCCGMVGLLAFTNGLLLLYLNKFAFGGVAVMVCLALPATFRACFIIPGAYWADRHGKKRLGGLGLALTTAGYAALSLGPLLGSEAGRGIVVLGVLLFSLGYAFFAAGWFALLSPIVPEDERGRFFGRMRLAWQVVGIVFASVCAFFLTKDSPLQLFQYVLAAVLVGQAARLVFYARIPEAEKAQAGGEGFMPAFCAAIRAPGYMSFCAYVFLLSLATIGVQPVFGLVEKTVLDLGDNIVVWLGNATMIGAVVGFFFGGKAVDRWSTKPVFLFCHFGYAAVLFLFLLRGLLPATVLSTYLGLVHAVFGVAWAASSIAISSEMLALIPAENKSLATSICTTLMAAGGSLSGLLIAWVLKLELLAEQWSLWGMTLSHYDAVLLFCGVGVLLLVVTLGLVPSVIGKAQWVPVMRK